MYKAINVTSLEVSHCTAEKELAQPLKARAYKTCSICGRRVKGYGYCNKHYIRFKKYGNPLMGAKGVME